jgi:Xaa-Pro aminopeptidase
METIALSKKNQKKIHKLVTKGQKKALKANKKAQKLIHEFPSKAKKVYSKTYNPKEITAFVKHVTPAKRSAKKSPVGIIAGVAAGVVVLGAFGALLSALFKGTDDFSEKV